jgi:hypothetical protein
MTPRFRVAPEIRDRSKLRRTVSLMNSGSRQVRRLNSGFHAELGQNILDMFFDGSLAGGENDGNRLVALALSNPMQRLRLTRRQTATSFFRMRSCLRSRPGVISFALGFGHWATGAFDVEIDGEIIKGEKRRQAGLHANAAMWVDPTLKNTCFLDPVGGSVSFYDTHVRLEKV